MFCGVCGNELLEGARFCGDCGAALVATAEAPVNFVSGAPASSVGAAPSAAMERPGRKSGFGYWAYKALTIGIALLAFAIFFGYFFIGAITAAIGACLWVGVTGRWPGSGDRAHSLVRGFLALFAIGVNGLAAVGVGYLAGSDCEICSSWGLAAGTRWGIGAFLGLAVLETIMLRLALGIPRLVGYLWRGGRRAGAS